MLLAIMISSLAVLHPVLSGAIPEDSSGAGFLSEDPPVFDIFDVASSSPLDSSNQPFDFLDSEAPSLEDDFFTDPSANTAAEDENFLFSADPILESSCMTSDSGFSRYVKKDGICGQRTDESLPSRLRFPTLNEIEEQVQEPTKEPKFKESNILNEAIPSIPGISSNDDLCPKPKRRLCCLGPPMELIPGFPGRYVGVNFCRDFGPLSCTARYDVCCQDFRNFYVPGYEPSSIGLVCIIISENPDGVEDW